MDYDKLYKDAVKNKTAEPLSTRLIQEFKPGEKIIGKLIEMSQAHSEKNDSDYWNYHIHTGAEVVKFSGGASIDADVRPLLKKGGIYSFEFEGVEEISAGRRMKKWTVLKLAEPDKE